MASTPSKSTPAKAAPEDQKSDEQKRSTKALAPGDHLWYRGDYGPVFSMVTTGGEGEAQVLLFRPDEVVKGRTVAVYDTPEEAERASGEGQTHVAWHLA